MMRRLVALLRFAIVLLVSTSCDDPTAPLPGDLTTDAASYIAAPGAQLGTGREYNFTLIARFTNTSRYTVHLSRCFNDTPYPIFGVSSVDGDTQVAYNPGWACVGGNYFDVAPGESRVDTLALRAPWGINGITGEPIGVFEGRFVLVYEMYGCKGESPECVEPIHGSARSNVFTVTRSGHE